MDRLARALAAGDGLVRASDHPALRASLYRKAAEGSLQVVLPGVFAVAGPMNRLLWLQAVCLAYPTGVLHADTAAGVWLGEPAPVTRVAVATHLAAPPGVIFTRRRVPGEFVVRWRGLRLAAVAYAVVELAARDEGKAIMAALRKRLLTTEDLVPAVSALAGSPGQRERRRAVRAAIRNPWSYAEMLLQRLLLEAGIEGWVANTSIRVAGRRYSLDILFEGHRLIIEFDGYEFHSQQPQFTTDRERQNALVVAGYRVLRFTWEHLTERPDYVVATVRAALRATEV